MLVPALLALAADDAALTRVANRLAPEERCLPDPDKTDVTVCGRRRADRFRVPLLLVAAGDPRHEGVWAERTRLLHRTTPIQDLSPFLVGGGMVGARATLGATGVKAETLRQLAP